MKLKKVNATVALAAALVIALHTAVNSRMMILGRVYDSPVFLAQILMYLALAHAAVSLFILLFRHDGFRPRYASLYKGMMLQRLTGILLIPLAAFHGGIWVGTLGIGLIPILVVHFFIMVCAFIHIPLSVPNALVTLGVLTTTKAYRRVRIVCVVLCALLFLLGLMASISEVIAL